MATDAVTNEDQTKVPSPAAKELLRALRHRLKAANPIILIRGLTVCTLTCVGNNADLSATQSIGR